MVFGHLDGVYGCSSSVESYHFLNDGWVTCWPDSSKVVTPRYVISWEAGKDETSRGGADHFKY